MTAHKSGVIIIGIFSTIFVGAMEVSVNIFCIANELLINIDNSWAYTMTEGAFLMDIKLTFWWLHDLIILKYIAKYPMINQ